jgi:hypothetical protein
MTLEHAVSITNDLLDVFQAFVEICPIQLSQSVENGQTKVKTLRIKANDTVSIGLSYLPKVEDEFCLDIIFNVIIANKRFFRITFFEDPDKLGYCSMLPDYDASTYVLCEMVEKRANGSTKHEMIFSFDIEKKTFLELFDIIHYNTVDIRREYPVNSWNCPVEEALRDAIIL